MNIRYLTACLFTVLGFALCTGCGNSESRKPSAPPRSFSEDTIARIHWVGKRRLGVDAGAYYLMRIWGLPASEQLEKQTLGKLSIAPLFFHAPTPALNPQLSSLLLRPVLNDALQEECYFEIRQRTNQSPEMVFAVRINDAQDGFWETNLAIFVQSFTGAAALEAPGGQRGWTVTEQNPPNLIQIRRIGGWTFFGIAQDHNALLDELLARTHYRNPFSLRSNTNDWLEADLDLRGVARELSLNWNLPANSPRVSLAITGDGGNVLTDGELNFPQPLGLSTSSSPSPPRSGGEGRGEVALRAQRQTELPSWDIPTNLIREPVTSFTAIRGIEPAFATSKTWADFSAFLGTSNPPPDQLCFWSDAGGPYHTYFAAPVENASNYMHELTERLMTKANPWLDSHNYVSFERLPGGNGVAWGNLSMVKPFLTSAESGDSGFVFGGLLANPNAATNSPIRSPLLEGLAGSTNLVYFDWEMTSQRVEPWLYISQITRMILQRGQFPIDSVAGTWLRTTQPRLGESTTQMTQTGPNQLSFTRKSTLGLTAPELHLLVDWLESPQFPRGLYTTSNR